LGKSKEKRILIKLDSKIYIAGHTGMVGSGILRRLEKDGYSNLIIKTYDDLDLTNQHAVKIFYEKYKPEFVFICAAKVGGIHANNTSRAQFIYENLQIQNNLIHFAYVNGVKKLLFLGSSCIYPMDCPQPIKEEYLLTGPLEPTNEPYAIAKIAGIKMCENYYRQYGCDFIAAMPTNLYGPHDNYDLNTSHVLPALIKKFYDGKLLNSSSVEVWGSGSPKREFLYVDDCVDACLYIFNSLGAKILFTEKITHLNIGTGKDISIVDLAKVISDEVQYEGAIEFNLNKPDGVSRKLLNVSRLSYLGWGPKIDLKTGIKKTCQWYTENYR